MEMTPNLSLPYILAAQAQKHVTHNEAIRALDVLVQAAVVDRNLAAPPASPGDGDCYIAAAPAAGAWAGHDHHLAAWQDGAWAFYPPHEGFLAWVADEDLLCVWSGTQWIAASGGGAASVNPVPLVGVNATADVTNRLAVRSPASLFDNEGAGHQLKINKANAASTASLLLQTGYTGHAEIGLAGDDSLHVKVSADGAAWAEALEAFSTGWISLPVGISVGTDKTAVNNASTIAPKMLFGGTGVGAAVQINRYTAPGAGGPQVILASSRGADVDEYTAVQANDGLGTFQFQGADGSRYQPAAALRATCPANAATGSVKGNMAVLVSQGTAANTQAQALLWNENLETVFYGTPRPQVDNAIALGSAGARFSVVYAATGTINTSDARDKALLGAGEADITKLAADMIEMVEPILYRWKAGSVELEPDGFDVVDDGETRVTRFKPVTKPGKRVHAGFRAQDVRTVLAAHGVDGAMWCLENPSEPDSRQGLRAEQLVALLWAHVRSLTAAVRQLEGREVV
jgi:hypothetical protein